MPADFEDRLSPDGMSDEELRRFVRQELETQETVDADNILVRVREGVVILSGRVGTEEELRVAEHVVTDVVGAEEVENMLVVDPIRRDEEPEAIDEHLAGQDGDEEPLGRPLDENSDAAELYHEDLDARLYGTHNLQRAIADGTAWEPPDSPTPEGYVNPARDPEDIDEETPR